MDAADALELGEEVFFCVTEGQGVFLDLKRDMYSAVPVPAHLEAERPSEDSLAAALAPYRKELLDEGLVRPCAPGRSRLGAFLSIARPRSHLFHPDDRRAFGLTSDADEDARISLFDIATFFLAAWRTSRNLKRRPLHEVVRRVRVQKTAAGEASGGIQAFREQTAIFRKLRPWWPRGYLCLFDALALVEFLARRQLFPDWVFGVQAQPFGAHCWVQVDGRLLNENSEYAGQFTPIMSI